MRASLAALLMLTGSIVPAWADNLFPNENPYRCIAAAKASHAPDARRREELADCMSRVRDAVQALEALQREGFAGDVRISGEVVRAEKTGHYEEARELLRKLIRG